MAIKREVTFFTLTAEERQVIKDLRRIKSPERVSSLMGWVRYNADNCLDWEKEEIEKEVLNQAKRPHLIVVK